MTNKKRDEDTTDTQFSGMNSIHKKPWRTYLKQNWIASWIETLGNELDYKRYKKQLSITFKEKNGLLNHRKKNYACMQY